MRPRCSWRSPARSCCPASTTPCRAPLSSRITRARGGWVARWRGRREREIDSRARSPSLLARSLARSLPPSLPLFSSLARSIARSLAHALSLRPSVPSSVRPSVPPSPSLSLPLFLSLSPFLPPPPLSLPLSVSPSADDREIEGEGTDGERAMCCSVCSLRA